MQSQDIEDATTAVVIDNRPDAKTRRYDRQLRLWAATGQSALESSRILLLSASSTGAAILKNLVLPGIGHFTVLDHRITSAADAGNNFFLDGPSSIGKPRAEEVVRLLSELNDSVEGKADTRDLKDILQSQDGGKEWLCSYQVIIAHNLETELLDQVSKITWEDERKPILVVVNEAGFLAEFGIQFHEHPIIESHSETPPSLRIDKAFPALLDYATSIDFAALDPTDHGHIPYVVILVRALEDWKKAHGGVPPTAYADKQAFKKLILAMKIKSDEENFDEAHDQAYRAWTATTVPSSTSSLFNLPILSSLDADSPPFFHLVAALKRFTSEPPHVLPLTSTLPDMKADTKKYILLQKLYKDRSSEEKETFVGYLKEAGVEIESSIIDSFVKNSHAIQLLRGRQWGAFDTAKAELAESLLTAPGPASTHLALTALRKLTAKLAKVPTVEDPLVVGLTADALALEALALLPDGTELPEKEWGEAVGELTRAPTASLPTTSAFLGGLVAQEVIKMVTSQYVPVAGICVVDLVETWTGVVGVPPST